MASQAREKEPYDSAQEMVPEEGRILGVLSAAKRLSALGQNRCDESWIE
jgi:hypothetical protein